ncbi:MAG: MGMT family protein [Verrucomicrobiota bacterium]
MKIKREPTPFEQKVYAALKKIPVGKVTTYAILAKHIGVNSARAVGQALRRNPNAPAVPCHRVVRSDLTLGGYQGKTAGAGLKKKIALLEEEGVDIDQHRVSKKTKIYQFR